MTETDLMNQQTLAEPAKLPMNRTLLILILGLLATIDPFSIDFYLPAFADIAKSLGTTTAKISLSMSSYFIGLAIGQISYGPIIDRFGRKSPLYFGLTGYILACVGCMFARSVDALIVLRFVQALAGGVAGIGAFAMVRDFFPVQESAKIFSFLMLVIGISPLLAPSLGGFIADWWGWQSVFLVLIGIVVVMMVVVYFYLPEGHQPDPSVSLSPKPILLNFYSILKNPQFITYTLSGTFSFTALFVYVAGAPVIFMDMFKVTPHNFGLIFTLLSVGFLSSSQLNVQFLKKFKSQDIFETALWAQVIISVLFFAGSFTHWYGLIATIIFFMLILSCLGSINPNGSALALAPFTSNVGSASALMGFLQLSISSVISSLIGLLNASNMVVITSILMATAVLSQIILFVGKKKIKHLVTGEHPVVAH
jgi:DHA1 family bicyclomycin/chloramphenicol resistance-like MFS transporter